MYIYIYIRIYTSVTSHKTVVEFSGLDVCRTCMHVKSTISSVHYGDSNDLLDVCSPWSSRVGQNVVLEQQGVFPEKQDRSKESQSSRICRNVVTEQQDRSKCRPGQENPEGSDRGRRSSEMEAHFFNERYFRVAEGGMMSSTRR